MLANNSFGKINKDAHVEVKDFKNVLLRISIQGGLSEAITDQRRSRKV